MAHTKGRRWINEKGKDSCCIASGYLAGVEISLPLVSFLFFAFET